MHLPTIRRRRETQARLEKLPDHPREIAVEWIRNLICDGRAGLDPLDPAVFVLVASANETTWAYRTLELTGQVLTVKHVADGARRYSALLEADVRMRLRLDDPDAPAVAADAVVEPDLVVASLFEGVH